MMKCDINKVIISGSVDYEGVLNFTSGGTAVMKFSLESTGPRFKELCDVFVWGDLAERLYGKLKKGMRVMVEGSLHRKMKREGSFGWLEINAGRVYSMEDSLEIY